MLRLSFDSTSLCRARLTGVGVYTQALAKALMANSEIDFSASYRVSRWKKAHYITSHLGVKPRTYFPNLPQLTLSGTDIFHGPDFKIPKNGNFKKIVTVHDLANYKPFYGTENAKLAHKNLNKMLFSCKPDHIITVSEYVKDELEALFPHTKGMVTAIHSGINHLKLASRKESETPVFIYIGTIEARKNLSNLIKAFALVHELNPNAKLILAGGVGMGGAEILEELANSKVKKAISYEGFISNERKSQLLSSGTAFIYPSLYEGFGLPILEAMLASCPVITANFGACAEISNNHAWEVNVNEPEAIAKAMVDIVNNKELASSKAIEAYKYSLEFTWERCAYNTYMIYKKVLTS
ncbi:MAG: glycosyltransferase family 4 protein [Flexibacteraceae bacterium]